MQLEKEKQHRKINEVRIHFWDFPDGLVAKIPSSECTGPSLTPEPGTRCQVPQLGSRAPK